MEYGTREPVFALDLNSLGACSGHLAKDAAGGRLRKGKRTRQHQTGGNGNGKFVRREGTICFFKMSSRRVRMGVGVALPCAPR